jgi:methyl-accepting chemotaxis protein
VDREELLKESKSLDVWGAYFDGLGGGQEDRKRAPLSSSDDEEMEESSLERTDASTLEDISRIKENFKTPKRLKMGPFLANDIDTSPEELKLALIASLQSPSSDDTPSTAKDKHQAGLRTVLGEWSRIQANFEFILLEMNKKAGNSKKYRAAVAETFSDLQAAVHETDVRIQLMTARLGTDDYASEQENVTLWEAVRRIQDDLALFYEEAKELRANDLGEFKDFLDEARASVPAMGTTLENLCEHYKVNMPKLSSNIAKMKTRVERFENRGPHTGDGYTTTTNEIDKLRVEVNTAASGLRTQIADVRTDLGRLSSSAGSPSGTSNPSQLSDILRKLSDLEGRISDDSFQLGGYTFSSEPELADWCKKEGVASCGMFWDLFSAMVVMIPKQQTGKDRADENYSSSRTATTNFENDLAASMSHERPCCLYGKNDRLVPLEDGFGACPTRRKWISGSESYKTVVSNQLRGFVEGVKGNLNPRDGGYDLARLLLTEVRSEWNDMLSFIDDFHIDLVEVARFETSKAWILVGRCVAAVFEAMRPFRDRVKLLQDPTTLENKAAYLWAVLQCPRVLQEFILVKFRGHPAIVKEMTLFMLIERVDATELKSMTELLKKVEKIAEQANSASSKLTDQVNALKRTHDNLANDVKLLKSKK